MAAPLSSLCDLGDREGASARGRPPRRPYIKHKRGGVSLRLFPAYADTPFMEAVEARGVAIRTSAIPNAGLGVFAREPLPAHRMLAWYRGEVLSKKQFEARYPGDAVGTYVLKACRGIWVDASDPRYSNWASRLNDVRGTGKTPNCELTAKGGLRTLRRIATGEELLLRYAADADEYWDEAAARAPLSPPPRGRCPGASPRPGALPRCAR
jgi:hypothetical protein